jgi:hypothetical protein
MLSTSHFQPFVSDTLESSYEPIRLQTHANSQITRSKSFFERFFSYLPTDSLLSAQLLKR